MSSAPDVFEASLDEPPKYEVPIEGTTDGGDRVPDLSPREALERWLNKLRVSRSESTVSAYHYRLKHFVEWCEEVGISEVGQVNGWDIESYETSRREQGLEPITLNNELGTLQSFFEYCVKVELVDEGLPTKVDPPVVPAADQVSKVRLHTDRAQALLTHYVATECGSRAHTLLALAWFTGARLGALRGLDLEDYDREQQCLKFTHRPREETPLKNGADGERFVGLPKQACDVVDAYIQKHRLEKYDDYGRRPLLTSERGRPSTNAVRAWMYLATVPCLHSPCPHGNDPDTCNFLDYSAASKCPSSRSPHQVRTGSITWQLNRGIPPERVAERVNTSIEVLLRHYDQPTRMEEMRERRRPYLDRLSFGDEEGDDR
ncbi:tyrosine-type recombinase/integrase [Natronosalvus caseinilyticus]|uniref:tyrosine-type recombinase/integrase n=1 Tax=Natronosalvus caseinilyticus TaxID=2953747 RepID=UPI0028ACC690|nr:site-specific integrase [Natronosalvus caseinilyticus]